MSANTFAMQVIRELGMTQEQLLMFSQVRISFDHYSRQVIRSMNAYEMSLIELVVDFPAGATTLKKKQDRLIMFIQENHQYEGLNYLDIWLKLAHQYFLNDLRKINIPEIEYERTRGNRVDQQQMGLRHNNMNQGLQQGPTRNANIHHQNPRQILQTPASAIFNASQMMIENDDDLEVRDLALNLQNLHL